MIAVLSSGMVVIVEAIHAGANGEFRAAELRVDAARVAAVDREASNPLLEEPGMAEVLGLGLTHHPMLAGADTHMANLLKTTLKDPDIPADREVPENWPELAQQEWGDDEGTAAAARHRARLRAGLDGCQEALDEFQPDVVVVWGDDQYENFREEIIPSFCVLAYDDTEVDAFATFPIAVQFAGSIDPTPGTESRVASAHPLLPWLTGAAVGIAAKSASNHRFLPRPATPTPPSGHVAAVATFTNTVTLESRQSMAERCRASDVTVMSMYGKSGRPHRMSLSRSLLVTSKMLRFANWPTQRHKCRHSPDSWSLCAYSFSAVRVASLRSASRSGGRFTVIWTAKSMVAS